MLEKFHYGNDVSSDDSDRSVRAAADGVVIENKFYDKPINSNDLHSKGWKYTILLEHYDKDGKPIYRSRYANLHQKPNLKLGQKVKEGSIIGVIGPAKNQESFLHFEIQKLSSKNEWEYADPTGLNIGKYEKLSDIPVNDQKSESHSVDIKVDLALADMIEEVMRKTKFTINISDMAKKVVNIDKIDGLNVCNPKAKKKVLELQKAFNEHPNIYRNYSFYGVWIKKTDGTFNYIPTDSAEYKKLVKSCHHIYISVR